MADLSFLALPPRLAKRLLALANVQPENNPADRVRLRVTQAVLGSMLGVSRESVNKQLNLFAREGWIALGRGWVALIDPEALKTFA